MWTRVEDDAREETGKRCARGVDVPADSLVRFVKMHGLGNDFIIETYLDHPTWVESLEDSNVSCTDSSFLPTRLAQRAFFQRLCARCRGIGADQYIVVTRAVPPCDSPYHAEIEEGAVVVHVRMRVWNADGSRVDACGNATRCVAALLRRMRHVETKERDSFRRDVDEDEDEDVDLSVYVWTRAENVEPFRVAKCTFPRRGDWSEEESVKELDGRMVSVDMGVPLVLDASLCESIQLGQREIPWVRPHRVLPSAMLEPCTSTLSEPFSTSLPLSSVGWIDCDLRSALESHLGREGRGASVQTDHPEDRYHCTCDEDRFDSDAQCELDRFPRLSQLCSHICPSAGSSLMRSLSRAVCVSMGNPHCVLLLDTSDSMEEEDRLRCPFSTRSKEEEENDSVLSDAVIVSLGRLIESLDAVFPERTNVEFVVRRSEDHIRMRVWERGCGVTQACGTGACASAVAASLVYRTPDHIVVSLDGGVLSVFWKGLGTSLRMDGLASFVFSGEIQIPFF